jgi:hypothetical protein
MPLKTSAGAAKHKQCAPPIFQPLCKAPLLTSCAHMCMVILHVGTTGYDGTLCL